MNILKGFESLIKRQSEIDKEVKELRKDEKVQKYLELQTERENIQSVQSDLYKAFKEEQFDKCNHMWVTVLSDKDKMDGRTYDYHGCVKCVLDKRVFHLRERLHSLDWLPLDQRIMYDFMRNHYSDSGINSNLLCDLDLAKAIYAKRTAVGVGQNTRKNR